MRWSWLIIVPAALLAACVEGEPPFSLGANTGGPGPGKDGCKVGFSQGQLVSGLCNDGPDDPEIAQPPIAVPPSGEDGVTAVVNEDGSITIPEVAAPPQEAYLWIANTNEATVSKIDVVDLVETGRYRSYRTCSNTSGATPFDDATVCNAFGSQAPSRTAIDLQEDAWVANRAFGAQATVTKIASNTARCTERNGIPGVQTSTGSGVLADDECVLFTVPVGGKKNSAIARALAVTPPDAESEHGSVWVGLYNDAKAVRLRNRDGKTMATFNLNVNTYGAVADSEGRVWYVGRGPRSIQYVRGPPCVGAGCVSPRFDIPAIQLSCPNSSATAQYGIAVDSRNRVYVQASECNYTHQFTLGETGLTGTWRTISLPGVKQGRGVSFRGWKEKFLTMVDGVEVEQERPRIEMWVTNYDRWSWSASTYSYATRFDADRWGCDRDVDGILDSVDLDIQNSGGKALTCDYNGDLLVNEADWDVVSYRMTLAQGHSPIGIGIDPINNRYVWTANQDGWVTRIDRESPDKLTPVTTKVRVGSGPYTYSDFTGSSLAQITRQGKARMVFAGGCPDGKIARWTELSWEGTVPHGTRVRLLLRLADADYDMDGAITSADAAFADPIGPYEQSQSGSLVAPVVVNDSPVNLTALSLPATAYAQLDIELFSSAMQSPTVRNIQLKRTCN